MTKKMNTYLRISSLSEKVLYFYESTLLPNILTKNFRKLAKKSIHIIKSKITNKPMIMILETGNVCNLNCPTCPTPRYYINRPRKNLSFQNFKKIVDNSYKEVGTLILHWTNEPLLNKDIIKMIKYVNRKSLSTLMSTNAILMDEKMCKEIVEAELDYLIVCLDGFSQRSLELFRGKGIKFEIVKSNIENLMRIKGKKKKPFVTLQSIENNYNLDELKDIEKFTIKNNINRFHIKSLYIGTKSGKYDESLKEFFSRNLKKQRKSNIRIKLKSCILPKQQIAVTYLGDVCICCYDLNAVCSVGNLLNESLGEIYKKDEYRNAYKNGLNRKLTICLDCKND